jgi:hypothetical protein
MDAAMKPCFGFSNSSNVCAELINVLRIPRITAETEKALKKGPSLLARMTVTDKLIFFHGFFLYLPTLGVVTSSGAHGNQQWMVVCEYDIAAKVIEGVPMVTAPNNNGLTNP